MLSGAHENTLIWTVASRHGRDLSGVVRVYEHLYGKSLIETVRAQTGGDLRALLETLLETPPAG